MVRAMAPGGHMDQHANVANAKSHGSVTIGFLVTIGEGPRYSKGG